MLEEEEHELVRAAEKFSERDPNFFFALKYADPECKVISGCMWMTTYQQYNLLKNGDLIFLDAKANTTRIQWPLICPCISNYDNSTESVAFSVIPFLKIVSDFSLLL